MPREKFKCQNKIATHDVFKKGPCKSCGGCTYCPPDGGKEGCDSYYEHKAPLERGCSKRVSYFPRTESLKPSKEPTNQDHTPGTKRKAIKKKASGLIQNQAIRECIMMPGDEFAMNDWLRPQKKLKMVHTNQANSLLSNELDLVAARNGLIAKIDDLKRELKEKQKDMELMEASSRERARQVDGGGPISISGLIRSFKANEVHFNTKGKLELINCVLGIDSDQKVASQMLKFPTQGYNSKQLSSQQRSQSRVKCIYSSLISGLDKLVCVDNANFHSKFLYPSLDTAEEELKSLRRIQTAAVRLSVCGNRTASEVGSALLAGSIEAKQLNALVGDASKKFERTEGIRVGKRRKKFGRKRCASSRSTFLSLLAGKELNLKREYAFRVKLRSAMDYLTSKLPYRPGMTRSVKIGKFTFHYLPVYQRGGCTFEQLFHEYKAAQLNLNEDHVGFQAFRDLVNFISKKGVTKTGLSTYYLKLSHGKDVLDGMLQRLKAVGNAYLNEEDTETLEETIKEFQEKSCRLKDFLTYGYAKEHLKMESKIASHCCHHALNQEDKCSHLEGDLEEGGQRCHEHKGNDEDCKICADAVQFFDRFEEEVVNKVKSKVVDMPEIQVELQSMIKTVPELKSLVIQFMAHKVRAHAQFQEIERLIDELKEGEMIITLDHKMKTLPMKNREAQTEFFGKSGMSHLGAMGIRLVYRRDKDGVLQPQFERLHFDTVFEDYKSQDSRQVLGAIQALLPKIKELYPEIKVVRFISDNAGCFASHDSVPFIYHLNKKWEREGLLDMRVDCWLYTEACTGKDDLDAHFSFINVLFASYILEDGNSILTEHDIFNALKFRGGIAGSHAYLMDASVEISGKNKSVYADPEENKGFKAKMGVRSTHQVYWPKDGDVPAQLQTISRITPKEDVNQETMDKYQTRDLGFKIGKAWKAEWNDGALKKKRPRFKFKNKAVIPVPDDDVDDDQPKGGTMEASFDKTLDACGIAYGTDNREGGMTMVAGCGVFKSGWAQHKNGTQEPMPADVILALVGMWERGQKDKSGKVAAEKAISRLVDDVILRDWFHRFNITVPRIKQFFQKNKTQMEALKADCLCSRDTVDMTEVFKSYVGSRVAFIVDGDGDVVDGDGDHANGNTIHLGTVKTLTKLKKEGRRKNSPAVGAEFSVQVDGQRRYRKEVPNKEIERWMKYFDEQNPVGIVDNSVTQDLAGVVEESVRTDSTGNLEVPNEGALER